MDRINVGTGAKQGAGHGRIEEIETQIPVWLRCGAVIGRLLRPFRSGRPTWLVLKPGSLGDAFLFAGALRELRYQFPRHRIVVVVSSRARPIFERSRDVDNLLTINEMALSLNSPIERIERVSFAAQVLRRKYTGVIYTSYRNVRNWADLIFDLVSAERKYCFADPEDDPAVMPENDAKAVTVTVARDTHELDRTQVLLQTVGCERVKTREDIRPDAPITEQDRSWAKERLDTERSCCGDPMMLALCPGARFKQKSWGEEKFAALLCLLAEERQANANIAESGPGADGTGVPLCVLVLGGEEDQGIAEDIIRLATEDRETAQMAPTNGALLKVVNLVGQSSIHQTMALIEQSDICVGNDTFGLHAAIAVGTPSVTVMWGGDGDRWVPWGDPDRHRMVRVEVECRGCRGDCTEPGFTCMDRIDPERVLSEVRQLPITFRSRHEPTA